MCLFPFPNKSSIRAKLKGITKFECGHCPECLQKKSRLWALRATMEAKVSPAVMVTLTYDTYKYVDGKLSNFEEMPTDPSIPLSKPDCQKFIKRLRKHFKNCTIKYILTAERGKRTHRAHYHAILFGITFDDLVKYKKSDRGNWIYKSKTLEKIWSHGICTVDCINVTAKTARYCTKYCAKDAGAEDTFMLFSHGIGDKMLLEKFNGLSYWIDGREYPIPKQIWQKKIEEKYGIEGFSRYHVKCKLIDTEKILYNSIGKPTQKTTWKRKLNMLMFRNVTHERGRRRNEFYRFLRDNDWRYKRYMLYWSRKATLYELSRPSADKRILSLPNDKYRSYKVKALIAKTRELQGTFYGRYRFPFVPPRSNCQAFLPFPDKKVYEEKSFAPLACHYRANDTKGEEFRREYASELKILKNLRRHYLLHEVDTIENPFLFTPRSRADS